MHPQPRQLAPVARGFHAAERQARVGFDHAVDEGAAGLDMRCQLLGARRVLAPDRRAEAEAGFVGDAQRVCFARGADHGCHLADPFTVVEPFNLSRTSRNQKLERRRPRRQTPYQADGDVGAPTSGIATLNPTRTWEAAPVFDLRYILVTNCDDLADK